MTPARIHPRGLLLALIVGASVALAAPVAAQDPDSVVVVAPPEPDSTAAPAVADTLTPPPSLPADTLPPPNRLPAVPGDVREEWTDERDIYTWDRDALLGRPHFTLLELLLEIPGTIPLRQGDYGTPEGIVLDGMAGGRVRVFSDGVEEIGLLGSAPDLSRIPLVGLERVVARRTGGELRIEITNLQAVEARPLTLIEAGTGDLDTNLFRGTFVSGDALGGAATVGIERIDTQGTGGNEPGARQGVILRYLRPLFDDRLTVAAELRRGISQHDAGSEANLGPSPMQRNATVLRARWTATPELVVEGFWARNSLRETEDTIAPVDLETTQIGGRAGWERGPFWARGEVRSFDGDLPSLRLDLDAGVHHPAFGSARLRWGRDSFDGESASIQGLEFETAPRIGFSLFGGIERGDRGWRGQAALDTIPVTEPVEGEDGGGDGTGDGGTDDDPVDETPSYVVPRGLGALDHFRIGVRFQGLGGDLSAAWLSTETDSIGGFTTFLEGQGERFAGVESTGWEVAGRWNLPILRGLAFTGSLQRWDTPGVLRPEEVYRAGFVFNRTYYDTGNFQLWAGVMAEGRGRMEIPILGTADPEDPEAPVPLQTVPFQQTWNAWLQMRIVTVRIFIRWENLTLRQFNQDFPDRFLPATRSTYGVRWTLFN